MCVCFVPLLAQAWKMGLLSLKRLVRIKIISNQTQNILMVSDSAKETAVSPGDPFFAAGLEQRYRRLHSILCGPSALISFLEMITLKSPFWFLSSRAPWLNNNFSPFTWEVATETKKFGADTQRETDPPNNRS